MGINGFFNFGSKLSSSTFQAHPKNLRNENIKNPEYADAQCLIFGVYDNVTFPVIFEQYSGRKLEDILDTGWAGLFIISERFKKVLQENKLTGWKIFPVTILDKKGVEIKGYHGLSVLGRCGPIDYGKSQVIEKQMVPTGPFTKYLIGQHVGLDTWDGSDFFLPQDNLGTIVTSKAANIIKQSKLTNVRLVNLADIEIPEFGVPGYFSKKDG